MKGEHISPRLHEGLGVLHRIRDHEVHIERHGGHLRDGLDHRRTDAEVRNEVPIHDIHVEPVSARGFDHLHSLCDPREVAGEQ